eukprot:300536-Amphidinium_carterae.1
MAWRDCGGKRMWNRWGSHNIVPVACLKAVLDRRSCQRKHIETRVENDAVKGLSLRLECLTLPRSLLLDQVTLGQAHYSQVGKLADRATSFLSEFDAREVRSTRGSKA